MTNRSHPNLRLRARGLAAAALVALGVGAAVPTLATAGQPAPTKVTIVPENDGFYGFVKSPRENKCANGRKVIVLKQLGASQRPGSDQKIGTDIAQANGDGYMWSTGNTGHMKGKFYARVKRTPDCEPDTSKSVRMTH
jgi:hypothetical protein